MKKLFKFIICILIILILPINMISIGKVPYYFIIYQPNGLLLTEYASGTPMNTPPRSCLIINYIAYEIIKSNEDDYWYYSIPVSFYYTNEDGEIEKNEDGEVIRFDYNDPNRETIKESIISTGRWPIYEFKASSIKVGIDKLPEVVYYINDYSQKSIEYHTTEEDNKVVYENISENNNFTNDITNVSSAILNMPDKDSFTVDNITDFKEAYSLYETIKEKIEYYTKYIPNIDKLIDLKPFVDQLNPSVISKPDQETIEPDEDPIDSNIQIESLPIVTTSETSDIATSAISQIDISSNNIIQPMGGIDLSTIEPISVEVIKPVGLNDKLIFIILSVVASVVTCTFVVLLILKNKKKQNFE